MLEIRGEPRFDFAQNDFVSTECSETLLDLREDKQSPAVSSSGPCPDATGLFPKINSSFVVFIYFFQ